MKKRTKGFIAGGLAVTVLVIIVINIISLDTKLDKIADMEAQAQTESNDSILINEEDSDNETSVSSEFEDNGSTVPDTADTTDNTADKDDQTVTDYRMEEEPAAGSESGKSSGANGSADNKKEPVAGGKTTGKPSVELDPHPGNATLTKDQQAKKQTIDSKYSAQFNGLKASCRAKSDALISKIAGEFKNNPDTSLDTIQQKFLGQVIAAEEECNGQFSSIFANAQQEYADAGLSASAMPGWQGEYEQAKAAARSAGIAAITSTMGDAE